MEAVHISDLQEYSYYGGLQSADGHLYWIRQTIDTACLQPLYDLMEYDGQTICKRFSLHALSSFFAARNGCIYCFGSAFEGSSPLFVCRQNESSKILLERLPFQGCRIEGMLDETTLVFSALAEDEETLRLTENGIETFEQQQHADFTDGLTDRADQEERQARAYAYAPEAADVYIHPALRKTPRRMLVCLNTQTKETRKLCAPDESIRQVCVHEGRIYFVLSRAGALSKSPADSLYVYDPKTKTTEHLASVNLHMRSLDAIGRLLYFFADSYEPAGFSSNPNLYALNLESNQIEQKLSWEESPGSSMDLDYAPLPSKWTQVYDERLFFSATIINHVNLFCFDGKHLHQILEWPGTLDAFAFVDQKLYFIGAKPQEMQELYLLDGEVLQLCSHFHDELDGKFISPAKPVFYTAANGSAQLGWVLEPIDYDPAKSYPGILWIHGGPKSVYSTVFSHQMQVMASAGYFVFFCNPTGSDGQGHAYADLRGRCGSRDYADLNCFLEAVLGKYPQIDEKRLGVIGGSYGGFMSAWMAAHSKRFAAAVVDRGISDWLSLCYTTDTGSEFICDQIGGGRFDASRLWHCSPLFAAAQISTPVLLLHPCEDTAVPCSQAQELYGALRAQNTDTRLVLFHHETHNLPRTGRLQARMRRLYEIRDWMDTYLKGNEKV